MAEPIPDFPTREGRTIRLRPWTHADADTVIAAGRDDFITLITTVPAQADAATAREFIDRQIGRPETDLGHARVIADKATDEAIGHFYVSLVHARLGRATMGYWILPDRRVRGAASEALGLASDWALDDIGLARVTLYIEPSNEASRRTAARVGFREEALLRDWETYDDGATHDMLSLVRLRDSPS